MARRPPPARGRRPATSQADEDAVRRPAQEAIGLGDRVLAESRPRARRSTAASASSASGRPGSGSSPPRRLGVPLSRRGGAAPRAGVARSSPRARRRPASAAGRRPGRGDQLGDTAHERPGARRPGEAARGRACGAEPDAPAPPGDRLSSASFAGDLGPTERSRARRVQAAPHQPRPGSGPGCAGPLAGRVSGSPRATFSAGAARPLDGRRPRRPRGRPAARTCSWPGGRAAWRTGPGRRAAPARPPGLERLLRCGVRARRQQARMIGRRGSTTQAARSAALGESLLPASGRA